MSPFERLVLTALAVLIRLRIDSEGPAVRYRARSTVLALEAELQKGDDPCRN